PAAIPVYPETKRICELLGADPRGLIASGSLLICCAPYDSDALLTALGEAGIAATVIAELGEEGDGVQVALDEGVARDARSPAEGGTQTAGGSETASWPRFAHDEAVRLL
ncbi:MAG TPA: hypothetical protein VJ787_10400, partial [Thermoleophilia bacterium]|nr:hypothetical protein [Thermoleophilia bacterium]